MRCATRSARTSRCTSTTATSAGRRRSSRRASPASSRASSSTAISARSSPSCWRSTTRRSSSPTAPTRSAGRTARRARSTDDGGTPEMTTPRFRVALLNGLNMTNLGRRDRHIYGTIGSLGELEELVRSTGAKLGVDVVPFHANDEGALVDFVEEHDDLDGYLINPGGLWAFG